jgi:hypothetical protein
MIVMKNKKMLYGILVLVIVTVVTGIFVVSRIALVTTAGAELAFETVEKGAYSGHDEAGNYVIKTQEDWTELWTKVKSNEIPQPELPEIDFGRDMVIAVFLGTRNTGGYGIEITGIVESSTVKVYAKEKTPEPGSMVTMALTQPYHIVKLQKVEKSIVFEME